MYFCMWLYIQVKTADFQQDSIIQEYGLRIHDKMEGIEGRVLDPPARGMEL